MEIKRKREIRVRQRDTNRDRHRERDRERQKEIERKIFRIPVASFSSALSQVLPLYFRLFVYSLRITETDLHDSVCHS